MAPVRANAESADRGIGETYKPGSPAIGGSPATTFQPFVRAQPIVTLPIVVGGCLMPIDGIAKPNYKNQEADESS
jgi:hypothetical protein